MFDLKHRYEVDAAMVRLRPFLDERRRGDELLYADIERIAQLEHRRIGARVKTFYKAKGISLISLAGRGWRLATDEEQARDVAGHHQEKSRRSMKRAHHASITADESKLSEQTKQLRNMRIRHIGSQLAAEKVAEQQARTIIGAPPTRPSLRPVK